MGDGGQCNLPLNAAGTYRLRWLDGSYTFTQSIAATAPTYKQNLRKVFSEC